MAASLEPVLSESSSSLPGLLGLPSLDETYGALLLGAFAGLLLYGILVNQAYRYARVYGGDRDRSINKAFVICILVLDTFDNVVILHACYTYLVSDYFEPLALLSGIWSIKVQPIMAGFTVLICQSFFARRVYILDRRHRVLVAFSIVLMLIMFGFAVAGTVIAFKFHTYAEYEHFYWIDAAACGAAIISDSLTAGVLILALRRQRTAYEKTNTLLNALIVYTINTGLLTGIVNTLALVFALAQPNTMIWIAVEFVAVRLYTNSVLAVLNSRRSLRDAADNSGPMDLELELQSASVRQTDGDGSSQGRSGFGDVSSQKGTLGLGWLSDSVVRLSRERGS
ncbi:hypothetical protein L226DRAFT_562818 [Lentinus tigrinus ALCF2SS1-7]|uniref:DUF6534 domain-containing protein n=1 Tax=Lentinus tigrinus ALCF2SS1-6 TaxID=1328759 RepID=A0A5C2S9F8_9APHY|nr:hypothetical protein L227DRAFT_202446 [Lentinus tigrinus ALCF2SS1-6]RPD70446.1 hypothetical protein L226DRAFT_562818 [Lentinus tigrinus ALCF2SS1-7]